MSTELRDGGVREGGNSKLRKWKESQVIQRFWICLEHAQAEFGNLGISILISYSVNPNVEPWGPDGMGDCTALLYRLPANHQALILG